MTERFNVCGAMLVKLFGDPDAEAESFSNRASRVRDIGIKSAMYGRVFFVALGLVGGDRHCRDLRPRRPDGDLGDDHDRHARARSPPTSARVYGPLTELTNARVDVMTALVSFERVFEVLDAPESHRGLARRVRPRRSGRSRRVRRRHVPLSRRRLGVGRLARGRRRPGRRQCAGARRRCRRRGAPSTCRGHRAGRAWSRWSGRRGAGKTTLASLVPRLYDVTSGAVRIDGHDVRELTQHSLRAAIGVVAQDPHLFHESVADNLRYAKPDATQAELEAACRAAQIHDVIAALPDGYDTRRRRARLPAVGWREAAARDRPDAVEEPGDRDPRRSDEPSRLRERIPRTGRARRRARAVAYSTSRSKSSVATPRRCHGSPTTTETSANCGSAPRT